jgi:hypothetical protein
MPQTLDPDGHYYWCWVTDANGRQCHQVMKCASQLGQHLRHEHGAPLVLRDADAIRRYAILVDPSDAPDIRRRGKGLGFPRPIGDGTDWEALMGLAPSATGGAQNAVATTAHQTGSDDEDEDEDEEMEDGEDGASGYEDFEDEESDPDSDSEPEDGAAPAPAAPIRRQLFPRSPAPLLAIERIGYTFNGIPVPIGATYNPQPRIAVASDTAENTTPDPLSTVESIFAHFNGPRAHPSTTIPTTTTTTSPGRIHIPSAANDAPVAVAPAAPALVSNRPVHQQAQPLAVTQPVVFPYQPEPAPAPRQQNARPFRAADHVPREFGPYRYVEDLEREEREENERRGEGWKDL